LPVPKLYTLDDIDVGNKKVLVRVDFNVPIDVNGNILDDFRIRAHSQTLLSLLNRGAAVVVLSHQGRPGDSDFVTLENHAKKLEEVLGVEVRFVNDVMGSAACEAIQSLRHGEILLLDNVRLVSEELMEGEPERLAKTYLVRRLAPHFNYFVFDAFATAHRAQPSIVGFPAVLPSVIGYVMKRELEALDRLLSKGSLKVFVLGGAKVKDMIKVVELLAKKGIECKVITAGLVGLVFHVAKGGKVSNSISKLLEERGLAPLIAEAKKVLSLGIPIETPYDAKVLKADGSIAEEPLSSATGIPLDIGSYTASVFSEIIRSASVVVMKGTAGRVEDPGFRSGTIALLEAALKSSAYVVIGGGHISSMLSEVGVIREKGIHISTAGGALLMALAGEELPALKALELSYKRFFKVVPS
jgi:phosphoglycerate kinase